MKKLLTIVFMATAALSVSAQASVKPAIPRDAALEAKVEKTLKGMTLDEKIGQMLELNFDIMGRYAGDSPRRTFLRVLRGVSGSSFRQNSPFRIGGDLYFPRAQISFFATLCAVFDT